jgi:RNA polymerase sigma-70 factor (ECF subfamily)
VRISAAERFDGPAHSCGDRAVKLAAGMRDPAPQPAKAASWTTERAVMVADGDAEKARRFRDAALPHLDDVYTLARYLMRDDADAQDAVQECYLRALRHFDTYHGPAMKPWLLAILRNVCKAEFARRAGAPLPAEPHADELAADASLPWQEPQPSPEAELLRRLDGDAIRHLIAALPEPFREVVVLRDINELSYRDIAAVAGVPVGTVMSRLARARAILRARWTVEEGSAP